MSHRAWGYVPTLESTVIDLQGFKRWHDESLDIGVSVRRVIVLGLAMTVLQSADASDSDKRNPHGRSKFLEWTCGDRMLLAREAAMSCAREQTGVREELRTLIRQEINNRRAAVGQMREEFSVSLVQARLQSREQSRKLMEETKEVCRIRARSEM
jgi:hypothetical protein